MSKNAISNFADNLSDLINFTCERRQKTMVEISKEIGISSGALSKYQNGRAVPGIDAFVKIADYFGVSFDYLLGRSTSKVRENTDIASTLRLSDEAIDRLKAFHDFETNPCNKVNVRFTNLILENSLYYFICRQLEDYKKERQENFDNPFRYELEHFNDPKEYKPFVERDKHEIDDYELEQYMLFKIKENVSKLIDEITAPDKSLISRRNPNHAEHYSQDK